MNKKAFFYSWLITFSFLLAATLIFFLMNSNRNLSKNYNKKLVDFRVTNINKDTVDILQHDSAINTVINYWATWCKPCIEELPDFYTLLKKENHYKIRFVTNEPFAKVKLFLAKNESYQTSNFYFLLNSDTVHKSSVLPETMVVNSSNTIIWNKIGKLYESDFREIDSLLDKKGSTYKIF